MTDFKDLFVFEIANNHQGKLPHGIMIIKEMAKITRKYKLNAGVKLQYRHLDTFIHPDYRNDKEAKHIGRFLSTELKPDQFKTLVETIKSEGLITVCTPFDERSVDLIDQNNVDVIKIASCSSDDWPLITRITKSEKPVIASTGGLELWQIDNLVSFLTHRLKQVGILHCIAIYPAPDKNLNINFIQKLIKRYPEIPIGYSGHEAPGNNEVIKIATAIGATIFERHVGIATNEIKLNSYSLNPSETEKWIESYLKAKEILGSNQRTIDSNELESLLSLKRGVFLNRPIKKGSFISDKDVFFAIPCNKGQVTSGDFGKVRARYVTSRSYKEKEALYETYSEDTYHKIRKIIHQARAIISETGMILSKNYYIELNHHYGIENFDKFGCIIIRLINREYCKKLIILFPGQIHPEQKHIKKEETFHILNGQLNLTLNGISQKLTKGDIVTIEKGVLHSFYSDEGAIIEEVSTTHLVNDSFYSDPLIAEQDPMQRKTFLERL
ncbi:MAG: N-acetylneuraminate synthase family protein [Bacteroidia bacterium]|nr:N-acetylneuraminate synthase family protein [Bacteroidia bacterium]